MPKSLTLLPDWYSPSEAPRAGDRGFWAPPLAAAIDTRGDTTFIVVLHHRSFEPAIVRELPRSMGMEHVDACLAEAVMTLSDYTLLLCCAIDPLHHFVNTDTTGSPSRWLWVRYHDSIKHDAYKRTTYLADAWNKPHYFALAKATQLQEDLDLLQDFDREFRYVSTLNEAMHRLKKLLLTRLPQDIQRVVRLHHDLSF